MSLFSYDLPTNLYSGEDTIHAARADSSLALIAIICATRSARRLRLRKQRAVCSRDRPGKQTLLQQHTSIPYDLRSLANFRAHEMSVSPPSPATFMLMQTLSSLTSYFFRLGL